MKEIITLCDKCHVGYILWKRPFHRKAEAADRGFAVEMEMWYAHYVWQNVRFAEIHIGNEEFKTLRCRLFPSIR